MAKRKFPYYSFLHDKNRNLTTSETFFESADFLWAILLEKKFGIIQKEFQNFFSNESRQLSPYFAQEMMNAPGKWQTIGFYFWGLRDKKNCKACHESFKLFNEIPGLVSVSFSLLEPNSEIKPHQGDTDAIYRCHLPLLVPGKLPEVGFQVGKDQRSWEVGKCMIFNDAAYHQGWNRTDSRRIVLILDIVKEEYIGQKKWICSLVLSSLILQKFFKISFKNKKNWFNKLFLYFMAIIARSYFSIINRNVFKYHPE